MRSVAFLVLAGALAACGCSKNTAKSTGQAGDQAAAPQPQQPERGRTGDRTKADDKRKSDGEKPNWLNDPRFSRKDQDDGPTLPVEPVSPTGKPSWGLTPPEGGWVPPNAAPPASGNPMHPPAGGNPMAQPPAVPQQQPPAAGGQPVAPPAPNTGSPNTPARRVVTMEDMREVWVFIENASGASGKMPGPDVIYAALVKAESPAAELVKNGAITLTGTRTRESVWAFETAGLTQGGLVASQNGVEKLTAAELTRRLMGK